MLLACRICGHDFCKACIVICVTIWSKQKFSHGPHRSLLCPLCRSMYAPLQDVNGMGICFTLKNLIEGLCPDRVAARRSTLEQQEQQAPSAGLHAIALASVTRASHPPEICTPADLVWLIQSIAIQSMQPA